MGGWSHCSSPLYSTTVTRRRTPPLRRLLYAFSAVHALQQKGSHCNSDFFFFFLDAAVTRVIASSLPCLRLRCATPQGRRIVGRSYCQKLFGLGTMAADQRVETQVGDLPEVCLEHVIALTSPRDASRCAAVSPRFRAAADSDHVWHSFLPKDHRGILLEASSTTNRPANASKKDAYLGLCDAAASVDDGLVRVWLEKASGAKCYALSARRLSLPWDDGEFCWRWTPHPFSRFAEVAELVDCTYLDIYARLPGAVLTPVTTYAAYLVYSMAGRHRGLSFPDQETAVAVGGQIAERHVVCLRLDEAEARKFRGDGAGGDEAPRLREDGWWEMEMGRLYLANEQKSGEEEVQASFEVLGWYPSAALFWRPSSLDPPTNFNGPR